MATSRPTPKSGPPRSVVHPLPIQNFQLSKEHFTTDQGVKQFNILMQQVITSLQAVQGVAGPSVLPSGIDVAGAKVSGLAAPEHESDAVSLGHAQGSFSPATQQQQLDIGAPYALKGLTSLFLQFNQSQAAIAALPSGAVILAKLTVGGTNGSITFKNGAITAFTNPT